MTSAELIIHLGKTVNVHATTKTEGYVEYNEWPLLKDEDHNGEPTFKVWNFRFTAAQVSSFRATPYNVVILVKKQTVEKIN